MEETGKVTSINQKPGKYGIALGQDNWYNGMGTCPCKKGDEVKITFVVNGQWKNIEKVEVLTQAKEVEHGADKNARLRRALDCVMEANQTWREGKIEKSEVADYAKSLLETAFLIGNE